MEPIYFHQLSMGSTPHFPQEAAAAAPFRGADDSLRLRVAVVATAALQSQSPGLAVAPKWECQKWIEMVLSMNLGKLQRPHCDLTGNDG